MAGWNLSEGICIADNVSENEFWEIINNILSSKSNKTTSYKYGFLKSIIDNIFNTNGNTVTYEVLFERFAEMYWNLVAKYKLSQIQATSRFSKSSVEIIIERIIKKYSLDSEIVFEALREDIKAEIIKLISKECSKYVVGAFFKDSNEKFYSFNRKKQIIIFQKDIIKYIIKYKSILSKLNYFEWIKFLEKTNDNKLLTSLAEKLDNSTKRGNLSFYKDFLFDFYKKRECFYCGKNLDNKKIEMDHFITWPYLKDDKQWNIVMSCRECNNTKRDKLPDKKFILKLIEQNEKIVKSSNYKVVEKEYKSYDKNKIEKMYNSAKFNGFNEIWSPKEDK